MRAMITGGGTGGHIYPALAIAEGIKNKYEDAEILYVGADGGLEKELATRAGYKFKGITVAGLERRISLKAITTVFKNMQGIRQSKVLLRQYQPDIVIGTGGYACGPLMLAAAKKGFPTLLHEQNAIMGMTNSILSNKVDKICLTFNIMGGNFSAHHKAVITGLPVRKNIMNADKNKGIEFFCLNPEKPVVLVTGGSQGAKHLNEAAIAAGKKIIAAGGQILHLTGPKLYQDSERLAKEAGILNNENYKIVDYLHEMEMALGAADIIISRSGASLLAEIMAVGRCSVLIPYPYATGDHQKANALSLVNRNAAKMILDNELSGDSLWEVLEPLLKDKALVAEMSKNCYDMGCRDAVDNILEQAAEIIKK
ncbi:MAG: undecaprenyldiphospho-muramoylpentapeptide beta-N-acetylglucosaminyltransferase [Bacillota bacterium]|jgi:UDP-N-acetylglucosamine--N-acetylmuramyl-(pentapeptide) pyrophosphoryl-undecaprenol N-acetylglucosamine transferase